MTPDTLFLTAVAMIAASLLAGSWIAAGESEPRVPVEAIRELEGYFDGCRDGCADHATHDDPRPARLRDRDGFLCEIPEAPNGATHVRLRHVHPTE